MTLKVSDWKNLDVIAGQYLRRATHVQRFYNGLKSCAKTQEEKLLSIVRRNRNSAFGKAHNFDRINSVEDYRRLVPPSNYEYFEPYIEELKRGKGNQLTCQEPFMFATTSGTTARPKFVPITPLHVEDYTHAFQVHNYHLVKDMPGGALGKFLIITSNDEEGRTEGGLPYGAVSGMLNKRQSPVIRRHFALPFELCKVKDVDAKYYLLLRAALVQNVTAMLACNPSSLLLLADQMKERAESLLADIHDGTINKAFVSQVPSYILDAFAPYLKPSPERAGALLKLIEEHGRLKPCHVFPDLAVLSCWKGGPMGFYLEQMSDFYGHLKIRDFGYMASEGRGTVPISSEGAGGPLAVTSHFFEFVHEDDIDKDNKRFYMAHELKPGLRYFIFFTTNAGLYRYNINDLMLVESMLFQTPVLSFVRKGGGVSSVTGEKITEEQVLSALRTTVAALSLSEIKHFTAEAVLDRPPHYQCYAEVEQGSERIAFAEDFQEDFLNCFDAQLKTMNPEYADKRDSKRLGRPRLKLLAPGTYARLRQQRVMEGAPEAQVKIPLLSPSGFSSRLSSIAAATSLTGGGLA